MPCGEHRDDSSLRRDGTRVVAYRQVKGANNDTSLSANHPATLGRREPQDGTLQYDCKAREDQPPCSTMFWHR